MQLVEYANAYASQRDLCRQYTKYLFTCIRHFTAFVGETALEDITSAQLNAWVDNECKAHSKRTARNKIFTLMSLIHAAVEDKTRAPLVGSVKQLKVPHPPVDAFTPGDVAKLVAGARSTKGFFPNTGIRKSDWWEALVRVGWDIGMRLGDLLDLKYAEIDAKTLLVVKVQHKTGRPHVGRLQAETWAAIQRVRRQGVAQRVDVVFPFRGHHGKFCAAFRRLAKLGGVEGTSKYLRRAGATIVWKEQGPAAAAKYLGHVDGTGMLAWANYVDRKQLEDQLPTPPPISGVPDAATDSGDPAWLEPPPSLLSDADIGRIAHQVAAALGHVNGSPNRAST